LPNPCNHYYWEDGDDSYVDFLVRNGYVTVSGNVASADEETDDEQEEKLVHDVGKKMDLVVKKIDELIEICRNVFAAILFLIAVVMYVAVVAK
jgi:enamine deaminase RidA (YjgF/YER057c/UK114 family)